jgi:formylglycine-generating enzyme required for sulfatase activity
LLPSYQTYVDLLVQALESHRLPVWMDRRINYGSRWPQEIEDHLERCQVFLLVMSPRSKESHWVDIELTRALERRKPIFPLLLEGEHWFRVGNIQAPNVAGNKLPPADFFESVRAYFPTAADTAESLSVQAVAAEQIPTDSAPPNPRPTPQLVVGDPSQAKPKAEPAQPVATQSPQPTGHPTAPGQNFTEDLGNGLTLEMVALPAGEFMMGSPQGEKGRRDAEGPQHKVSVPGLWMGKFPVTQAQYQMIMGNNPSHFTENGASRPVERASWHDAVAFCEQLSQRTGRTYRLPSEAEWEYACRAGTTTRYAFGDSIAATQVNCDLQKTVVVREGFLGIGRKTERRGSYLAETSPVGRYPANQFSLHDMHGNVWEWCQDIWHDSYDGAPTDGSAWVAGEDDSRRVRRGGSWYFDPRDCRSASRDNVNADFRSFNVGFRVCCSAPRT